MFCSNECKRRKIKCNGNTPCQRCGNLNLSCEYAPNCCSNGFKDSDEFNLNSLRNPDSPADYRQQHERSISASQQTGGSTSLHRLPRFQGPTSSAFSIDVAKNTLHTMGYPGLIEGADDGMSTQNDTPMASPPLRPRNAQPPAGANSRDPLWSVDKDEAVRLCRVYEEV